MQVLNVEGFEKRILYNAAKAYSVQLDIGESYSMLNPVIALTITDFSMFAIEEMITRYILKEKDYLVDYPIYDIELVFVELPKFNKTLSELETIADKWIYFLKNARGLESIPEIMGNIPEIKKAFDVANRANLSRDELDDLEHREIFIHDQKNIIKKALSQGLEQGIQQGIKQGLEEGLEQGLERGLEQGRLDGILQVARELLDILDDETISQKTGLQIADIRNLRVH